MGSNITHGDSAPGDIQSLNGREALNNPARRLPSRVAYVPVEIEEEPVDSTRIVLLTTGRVGVIFSTRPDGRRRQVAVDTLTEAEQLVVDHRRAMGDQ